MTHRIDELLRVANAISRGEIPEYQHNECFTSGAFDLLLINVAGPEAFHLLSAVCQRYSSVKATERSMSGYFYLLEQLVHSANTTELPSGIESIIASHPELSHGLRTWYRIQG